jgi:hypothetical protein
MWGGAEICFPGARSFLRCSKGGELFWMPDASYSPPLRCASNYNKCVWFHVGIALSRACTFAHVARGDFILP